jgi:hypothetical protein
MLSGSDTPLAAAQAMTSTAHSATGRTTRSIAPLSTIGSESF